MSYLSTIISLRPCIPSTAREYVFEDGALIPTGEILPIEIWNNSVVSEEVVGSLTTTFFFAQSNNTSTITPVVGPGTPWVRIPEDVWWFWCFRVKRLKFVSPSASFTGGQWSVVLNTNSMGGVPRDFGSMGEHSLTCEAPAKGWDILPEAGYSLELIQFGPPSEAGSGGSYSSRPLTQGEDEGSSINSALSTVAMALRQDYVGAVVRSDDDPGYVYVHISAIFNFNASYENFFSIFLDPLDLYSSAGLRTLNSPAFGYYPAVWQESYWDNGGPRTRIESLEGFSFSLFGNSYTASVLRISGNGGGISESINIAIDADEYWTYDPGDTESYPGKDGSGPVYDSVTGEQLRNPFNIVKRTDGSFYNPNHTA